MNTHSPYSWFGTRQLAARLSMLANAAVVLVIGYSVLTRPLYIPLTVGLWLGAAAMIALAFLTPFPDD